MNRKTLTVLVAGTLGMIIAAPFAWAGDQRFSLSSEFDSSSDNYQTGPWMLKLTTPVGSGNASQLNTRIGTYGMNGGAKSGPYNTEAAVSYNLYEGGSSSPEINLTGKVSVNSNDKNSEFSLTQNGYAAQMDVYQNLDKFTAMGSLGSTVLASPGGITITPLLYGSFGGIYQFTENTSTGIDMSLSQNSSATNSPATNYSAPGLMQQGLSAFVNYKLDSNFKARGYVSRGISSGSTKSTVGGQVYYGF
ncbi:MAG: hypothetical protein WBM09_11015 [Gallionella sp.]